MTFNISKNKRPTVDRFQDWDVEQSKTKSNQENLLLVLTKLTEHIESLQTHLVELKETLEQQPEEVPVVEEEDLFDSCPLSHFLISLGRGNMGRWLLSHNLSSTTGERIRHGKPVANRSLIEFSKATGLSKDELLYSFNKRFVSF